MPKEIVISPEAPAALGPYSHAVKAGKMLFISGQIAIDPKTGKLPSGIEAQTRQTFQNIQTILHTAGFTLAEVVACDVFLTNLDDFSALNQVYAEIFASVKKGSGDGTGYPSRVVVEVSRLPKGSLLEIKVTAMKE